MDRPNNTRKTYIDSSNSKHFITIEIAHQQQRRASSIHAVLYYISCIALCVRFWWCIERQPKLQNNSTERERERESRDMLMSLQTHERCNTPILSVYTLYVFSVHFVLHLLPLVVVVAVVLLLFCVLLFYFCLFFPLSLARLFLSPCKHRRIYLFWQDLLHITYVIVVWAWAMLVFVIWRRSTLWWKVHKYFTLGISFGATATTIIRKTCVWIKSGIWKEEKSICCNHTNGKSKTIAHIR